MLWDVRQAIRGLLASRQASAAAIATLALAIGANGAAFSLTNSLLLRDLPVDHPEKLATVSSDFAIGHGFTAGAGVSYRMWEALRQRSAAFAGAFSWSPRDVTLGRAADSVPGHALYVSGDFFRTLGVRPLRGRVLTTDDDVRGTAAGLVGVISDRFWQQQFGRDERAVGSSLNVDGVPVTIVGVAQRAFAGLEVGRSFDVIVPLGADSVIRGPNAPLLQDGSLLLLVMVRLRDGQSIESATQTLRALQPDIVPANAPQFVKEPFTLVPAAGGAANPGSPQRVYERSVFTLLFGVGVVLVIACVNVANLQLTRANARRHDASVRVALGASRWRLARMQLVEGLMLSLGAAAAGLLLAFLGSRAIVSLTPIVLDFSFDWRLAAFSAAVTVVTTLLVSVAPAFIVSRTPPAGMLRAGGRGATGAGLQRVSSALTLIQIALALVLVLAAGLLAQTFAKLARRPLGFDPARLVVMTIDTSRRQVDDANRLALYERLVEAAAQTGGVERAAGSIWTPFSSGGFVTSVERLDVQGTASAADKVDVIVNFVTPEWFAAYGIPVRLGRDFGAQDRAGAPGVMIVNEAFVRRIAGGHSPVGFRTRAGREIVGIVGDAVSRSAQRIPGVTSIALREPVAPTMYIPLAQTPRGELPPSGAIQVTVRPSHESDADLPSRLRQAVVSLDPNVTVTTRRLTDTLTEALSQERLLAALSVFFGGVSLFLAAVGIYGLMSYGASLRLREVGVRLALGATRSGVTVLMLRRAVVLISAGMLLGLAVAILSTRLLSDLLFGVSPLDPATFGIVAILLAGIGILAAFVPAYRASHLDPASVLRAE